MPRAGRMPSRWSRRRRSTARSGAKHQNEATFQLDVSPKTPFGEYLVFVVGKSKIKDREFSTNASPFPLLVGQPFDLKIEPEILDLKPGDKVKVKITALRKGGYK